MIIILIILFPWKHDNTQMHELTSSHFENGRDVIMHLYFNTSVVNALFLTLAHIFPQTEYIK